MKDQRKNGSNNNETLKNKMAAAIENIKSLENGHALSCELKNVPVAFVNAVRRIVLGSIPTVVIRDVQLLDNTTQLPHEMLKHRVEMLPVNVHPTDAATIKDAQIELRIHPDKSKKDVETITTADFVIQSGRDTLLMKDRDLGTPLVFLRVRPGESVHVKARLAVENEGVSQVCGATTRWHVDPDLVQEERRKYVEAGNDVRVFDNVLFQRHYSRDENGRPNWFDLFIESIGVLKPQEILKMSIDILRKKLDEYLKEALENIQREADEGSYRIAVEQGGHTIGYLLQEVMYNDANVNFVAYDIPHPLRNTMVIRLNTKKTPESIFRSARETIEEYCSVVEKAL